MILELNISAKYDQMLQSLSNFSIAQAAPMGGGGDNGEHCGSLLAIIYMASGSIATLADQINNLENRGSSRARKLTAEMDQYRKNLKKAIDRFLNECPPPPGGQMSPMEMDLRQNIKNKKARLGEGLLGFEEAAQLRDLIGRFAYQQYEVYQQGPAEYQIQSGGEENGFWKVIVFLYDLIFTRNAQPAF
jgi:hypothetical protein